MPPPPQKKIIFKTEILLISHSRLFGQTEGKKKLGGRGLFQNICRNVYYFLEVCLLTLSVYHKYSACNLKWHWNWDNFLHSYKKEYEFGITLNPQTLEQYSHIALTVVATYVWTRGRKKFKHGLRLNICTKQKTGNRKARDGYTTVTTSVFILSLTQVKTTPNYRQYNFAALFIWIIQLRTTVYQAAIREPSFLSSHNFLLLYTLSF